MPSGSAVIRYHGKRGVSWRIKYRDADGRQTMETLGRSPEWNRRKAEAALRHRLADVEREGFRRPEADLFEAVAQEWIAEYPDARALKHSTRRGYEQIVRNHLVPALGRRKVVDIRVEDVERMLTQMRRDGLSAATCNRVLNVLSLILKAARRRGIVRENIVTLIDRPREARKRWPILTPDDVRRVESSFNRLIQDTVNERERDDLIVARRLFIVHMGCGLRRGEAVGLRWRNVNLTDPDGAFLRIEETWVRSRVETPKSDAGMRTISLGEKLAGEFFDHLAWTHYTGENEYVFSNPRTGHPFNATRYGDLFRRALRDAGLPETMRPTHDLRHSSITNAAASGTPPEALMTRAGHSSYSTTKRYIDLAGERFRSEAERLETRLWGVAEQGAAMRNGDIGHKA
jgi:integrase